MLEFLQLCTSVVPNVDLECLTVRDAFLVLTGPPLMYFQLDKAG
jgi:hypothetical protein